MKFGQPTPVKTDGPSSWDLVIEDMTSDEAVITDEYESLYADILSVAARLICLDELRLGNEVNGEISIRRFCELAKQRDDFGFEKYGTRLQPFNGRDSISDCIEEVLDLCVYYKTFLLERNK